MRDSERIYLGRSCLQPGTGTSFKRLTDKQAIACRQALAPARHLARGTTFREMQRVVGIVHSAP